mgnify:CR=1 FL=1
MMLLNNRGIPYFMSFFKSHMHDSGHMVDVLDFLIDKQVGAKWAIWR